MHIRCAPKGLQTGLASGTLSCLSHKSGFMDDIGKICEKHENDVLLELEKYVEAGSIFITDDFDFYDAYEKAMEMRF